MYVNSSTVINIYKDTAKNLLAMGLSVADIAKATGLAEEEITSLVT
mgnify:CR=1 FL=1